MKKLIMFSMLIAIAVPVLSGIASANVPTCITICPPGAGPDDLITLTAYDEEGVWVDLSLWSGGVEMNFAPLDIGEWGFYFTAEDPEMVNGTLQIVLGEERYGNPNWDFFTWSDHEEDDAEIQIAGNGQPTIEEVVAAGGTCEGIGCTLALPAITVDSNDLPVYEEQDAGGPPTAGPAEGQLLVSLAWQPGEPTYPAFTAVVVIDPNVDGDGPNEDFIFPDSDPCLVTDGSVTLSFSDANWSDPQAVAVQALQDTDREGDESYPIELTVTINIADPNFGNPTPVVVESRVTVIDNDIPFVSAYPGDFELSESDPCTCVDLKVRLSHLPTDDVYVRIYRGGWGLGEDDRPIMASLTPPLDPEGPDPNVLTFTATGNATWNESTMTSNWNVEQTITICPIDNDELTEPWVESIESVLFMPAYSEDVRYRVPWFNSDGEEEEPSGGEAEETVIVFYVNDNECGAITLLCSMAVLYGTL
jgi:hypothetical protein